MPRWTVTDRAREYARRCPGAVQSGGGGSNATIALACALVHGFALDAETAYQIMRAEWNSKCSPPWDDRGLRRKAYEAAEKLGPPNGQARGYMLREEDRGQLPPPPPRAQARPVEERRQKFDKSALADKFSPEWAERDRWRKASPVREPGRMSPGEVLSVIFRPGDRVLVMDDPSSQGAWMFVVGAGPGAGWYRLDRRPGARAVPIGPEEVPKGGQLGLWFLTNPVDGAWRCQACGYRHPIGQVLGGRMCPQCDPPDWETARRENQLLSRRTWRNVTRCENLMLEHDPPKGATDDETAALKEEHGRLWLSFLARMPLPLVSVTTSGGKSVHGVFRLRTPHGTLEEFGHLLHVCKRHLERYGADAAAMRSVQLTRLPNVLRGRDPQECLYLDPDPDDAPVMERAGVSLAS